MCGVNGRESVPPGAVWFAKPPYAAREAVPTAGPQKACSEVVRRPESFAHPENRYTRSEEFRRG
jgi:hypothetical protein